MPRRIAGFAIVFATLYVLLALPVLLRDAISPRVLMVSALLGGLLALLAAYDLEQMRLPDWLTLPLAASGLAGTAWIGTESAVSHALAAAGAALALWLVGFLYERFRSRQGLGLGDVKLFGALGAWVGAGGLASTLLAGCLIALTALIAARLAGRQIDAVTPIPFGIFLALGGWITWVYGPLV